MSGRDANQLAQKQALVRNQGACGEASPDGEYICVLPPGEHAHPWDRASGDANQLAADAKKAHQDALMALAADVHPYSAQAVHDNEQALYAALDELVALVGTLQQRSESSIEDANHWLAATREANARAEAAEAALADAKQALVHHGYGPRLCKCANCEAVT